MSGVGPAGDVSHVAVVGAGVAGLTCARHLAQNGFSVDVFEMSDRLGGRVGTDDYQGYQLDLGFQILIDSYPEVRRQLDLNRLELRAYGQGAVLAGGRAPPNLFANPLTCPAKLPATIKTAFRWGIISTLRDVCGLLAKIIIPGWLRYWRDPYDAFRERWAPKQGSLGAHTTTKEFLHGSNDPSRVGLSAGIYHEFLRPFFEAIYVSPLECQSAGLFEFVLRMLACGRACIPRRGMRAVPAQLAEGLSSGEIRLKTEVISVSPESVTFDIPGPGGIFTRETVVYDAVVVAASQPLAKRLLSGLPDSPGTATSSSTFYFGLPASQLPDVGRSALIVLNRHSARSLSPAFADSSPCGDPTSKGFRVCNIGFPSVVQPAYAPEGFHLAAVTVMCQLPGAAISADDFEGLTEDWVRTEVAEMLVAPSSPGPAMPNWRFLRRYDISYHQPPQVPLPPLDGLPHKVDGVFCCGDHRAYPTLDGAMRSGRLVAEEVCKDLKAHK